MSKPKDGVIKFQLDFTPTAALPFDDLRELNAWRKMMHLLELIGQTPSRYGGYGFGNISQRVPPFNTPKSHRQFVITGTQTGGIPDLTGEHYAKVLEFYHDWRVPYEDLREP